MDDGGTELTYPVLRYPTFSAPPLSPEVASCDKMHEDAMSDEESFPPSYSQSLPSIFVNVAWEDSSKKPFGFLTLPSLHVPLAEVREALYDQIDHKDITRQSTSSEDDIEKKRRIHLRFIREGVTVSPQQENTVVLDDILHRPTTTKTKSKSSTTATPSPILILRRLAPKPAKSKSEKSRGGWCCGCKCYHALLLLALVFSFSLLAASSRPSISESYSYVVSTQAGSSSLTESSAVDAPLPTPAGGGSSSSSSEDDSNTPPWMHPVFKLMHFILKTLIVLITEYYQLMIYMFSGNNPLYQILPMMNNIMFWYFETFKYCWGLTCELMKYVVDRTLEEWKTVAILVVCVQGCCFFLWRMQISITDAILAATKKVASDVEKAVEHEEDEGGESSSHAHEA